MNKNKINKEDGRYLIYYTFEGKTESRGKYNHDNNKEINNSSNQEKGELK
jgi:hypothetical protein